MNGGQITPECCLRFNGCSANICPFDSAWRLRKHLDGERVCGLLTESVKPDAEARLRGVLPAELVEQVLLAPVDNKLIFNRHLSLLTDT